MATQHHTTVSRRASLIGMLALPGGCVAIPAPAPHPDAALIADCGEMLRLRNRMNRAGTDDDTIDRLMVPYTERRDAVCEAEPQTMTGLMAVAWSAENDDDEGLAWAAVRGLLRLQVAAA